MRRAAGFRGLLIALLVMAAPALAQIKPEPHPAMACTRVKAGEALEPEYPFDAYKRKQPGRVLASVTLPGGLLGNGVDIRSNEGDESFATEVRRWLRTLEAPCLKPGETATLVFDFIFQPDRREVLYGAPKDARAEAHEALASCVTHGGGAKQPEYPAQARRRLLQGRVHARLSFASADAPPQVEIYARDSTAPFQAVVEAWTAGLRMPCHPGGEAVPLSQLFVFVMEDAGAFGFKPTTLMNLLGSGKGLRERPLVLDTTQMGCPFELKFTYYQPLRANSVGQVGSQDARRQPLLELLRGLELDLGRNMLDAVYADTADVTVPCLRLNHNPLEKKS